MQQPKKPQSDPKIDRHASSSTSHSPENPPPFRPPLPGITFSSRTDHSSVCEWTVPNFTKLKAKSLYSPYFQVGEYDFRILLYPRGDSLAVPGHISVYLQINCPKSSKLDCFAGYKLTMVNTGNVSKSVSRESYNRFTAKRKSVGWGDFTVSSSVRGKGSRFLLDGSLVVKADIRILNESVTVSADSSEVASSMSGLCGFGSHVASSMSGLCGFGSHVSNGKVIWKIHNYMLFKDMIKTYKIMSPSFQVGESNVRISVHRSVVGKVEYLALTLENNDTDKIFLLDKSCWCLFRLSVLNQLGLDHVHKDSYGRIGLECFGGDASLGWTDYMKMSDFVEPGKGFLVDGTVVFSASFNAIKDSSACFASGGVAGVKCNCVMKRCDGYLGKFLWKIENFSKLKDLLKKKKKVGLCVKGKRFQVGKQDFRLLVYPRGQSQKPCYLSIFLNVLNPKTPPASPSCFVHYRVSVINQRTKEKSITMASQNRCSKATTDWGWWEFMSLANLFDQDSGFVLQDTVLFCAEVHVLKETFQMRSPSALGNIDSDSRPYLTWKLENFLSLKAIMGTGKIFSSSFQCGGCELRMGIYDSFGTLFMYLECDPSVEVDHDKNFWVKYRMGVVNQKDSAKSWWKELSICTSSCSSSDIKSIRIADLLEVENGFLVREMVIFACEILDYCPWFDFPGLEFLDLDNDRRALSNDQTKRTDCRGNEISTEDTIDIFNDLLRVFIHEDDPSEQLNKLKVRSDVGAVANFLIGLRIYLEDPAEMKHLKTEFSKNSSGQKTLVRLVKVLKHAINHVIFDIMVECCLRLEGRSVEDSYDGSSKPYPAPSACDCPSPRKSSPVESVHASIFEKLFYEVNNHTATNAGQRSDVNATDIPRKQCIHLPETCSENPLIPSIHSLKAKWPQASKELLVLIVNSLKGLKGMVSEDCPEPKERPQLSDKIFLLLDKAPKHLLPDLITSVVKLINHLEHPLVASTLLDHLQKHEVESTLQISVFATIGQLDLSSEVWKQVLTRLYIYFLDSKEELLGATISLLFKAASRCQHIPQAVRFVCAKLESLGANVSSCLLDHLSRTIKGWSEIAETVISQIKSVFETGEKCVTGSCGPSCDEKEVESKILYSVDGWLPCADYHFLSVYCLIEMVSIPSLAVEAAQTFERGVAIGLIKDHLVAKVLERRHAQMLSIDQIRLAENDQRSNITGHGSTALCHQEVEFHSVLHLAELLSLSKNSRVHGFVRFFYATLVRLYANDRYHRELLEGLVERAMNPADSSSCESFLGILTFLMQGENEIARLFVSMMREAADQAHADREALWNRLCASNDEHIQVKEEVQVELRNIKKQNASLLQRLSESEATVVRLKSEERLKEECFAREKKEHSERIHKVTSQLEHFLSERDDEIAKFSNEKKVCQDRICDLEKELVHLESRKHDESKRAGKEKNMLAHKLRKVEAERENFEAELKQSSMEAARYKSVQRSLLDEVGLLKQEVTQTKAEKQEMEEEVARCKARIIEMERTLNNCKQRISSLEVALREEMLQHAPLYGVGLENLSKRELETVSRIHEEGLREIHALQNGQQSSIVGAPGPMGNPPSSASSSQHIGQVSHINGTAIGRTRPVR